MAAYFLDSSALVKRYANEVGTLWMTALLDPSLGNLFYVARITGVEVVAALARRARSANLTQPTAARTIAQFKSDFDTAFRHVEITPALTVSAMRHSERHVLRGYDAVQLAAALEVDYVLAQTHAPLIFVSADKDLLAAASNERLMTEDPNDH